MRKDLAKCTTEQERHGSKAKSRKFGGRIKVEDFESTYDKEAGGIHSMSRHRNLNYKTFSDVLSPLRGVLRKNVGRPWDKVYSEFSQVLDKRSNAGIHIIGHMKDYVAINCVIENGKIYEHGDRWHYGRYPVEGWYVHPTTKILCWAPYVKWQDRFPPKVKPITQIKNGELTYELIDGFRDKQGNKTEPIWFRGIYKDVEVRESVYGYVTTVDPETNVSTQKYSVTGHKMKTDRQFTNKQVVNKKDMKFINGYIAAVEKQRRRKVA